MKFRLEIQCDNAVFEDQCGAEVARILREAADMVDGCGRDGLKGFFNPLRDENGNRVGQFKFHARG